MAVNTAGSELTAKKENNKLAYFVVGLAILGLFYVLPTPEGLEPAAIMTLGIMITAVFWWVTETLPIPVTGLMIPVLLHVTGVIPMGTVITKSFGNQFVPFLIGVLALSVAFSNSGLSKRITFIMLTLSGTKANRVVGIFLWVSFVISMFITDVAVVAMMIPITVALLKSVDAMPGKSNFGRALMMAIMFGSTLGGITTPSGVAANVITMSFLKDAGIHVTYLQWVAIAAPIFATVTLIAWWAILKLFPLEMKELPYGKEVIEEDLRKLGSWSTPEKTTFVVFLLGVALWLTGTWNKLPIELVSLLILGLLVLPKFGAFKGWREIEKDLEWGGLLLVVGGYSLGVAAVESGLAHWVASTALQPMAAVPLMLQPLATTLLVALDSLGFSSMTAAASVNVPFMIAYAEQHGLPVQTLAMAAGFASSTHFLLVTQSPSFVLPYAYGYFSFKDMFKIGLVMTFVSAIFVAIGLVLAGMPAGVPLQ